MWDWRLNDPDRLAGGWSFDALSPLQDVGDLTPSTPTERMERLEAALRGES